MLRRGKENGPVKASERATNNAKKPQKPSDPSTSPVQTSKPSFDWVLRWMSLYIVTLVARDPPWQSKPPQN